MRGPCKGFGDSPSQSAAPTAPPRGEPRRRKTGKLPPSKLKGRRFAEHGYTLPQIVFWNVASCGRNQPVTRNEQGAVLLSGCTPRLFSMAAGGGLSPYAAMMEVLESERYAGICA